MDKKTGAVVREGAPGSVEVHQKFSRVAEIEELAKESESGHTQPTHASHKHHAAKQAMAVPLEADHKHL